MSELANTLHVMRMPVPTEDTARVSMLDYVSLVTGVVTFGLIFLYCLHRWL